LNQSPEQLRDVGFAGLSCGGLFAGALANLGDKECKKLPR
jgi:hypothetical protein